MDSDEIEPKAEILTEPEFEIKMDDSDEIEPKAEILIEPEFEIKIEDSDEIEPKAEILFDPEFKDLDEIEPMTEILIKPEFEIRIETAEDVKPNVDLYFCQQCSYSCKERRSLWRHRKIKHDGIGFYCKLCEYKTTRKEHLSTHVAAVHLGVSYLCDQCEYKATQQCHLKRHKDAIHGLASFHCNKCEYKSTLQARLKDHIKSIHGGRRFICEICDFKSTSKSSLAKHIKGAHTNVALNNNALKNHIIAKHTGNIHRKLCPHCPMRVKDLESHIENSHVNPQPKDKKHACDTCPYRTHVKSALNSHIKMTHLKLSKPCPVCEKNIIVSKMRDHMKCHQINQYSCVACGKTYREKFDLSKHILYFHRKFRTPCKYCGKKEVTNIKSHVRFSHPEITEKIDISADLEQIRIIKRQLDQRSEYYGEQDVIETGETDPIDANVES
eukprot:GFUD01013129.1.p1 GENE.GFUD01013129.1~~GFUD01013129.1.p1  ORF type:complete len:441 (-),score=71.74 GFUD01013129.1:258-1580(-)